MVNALSSTLCCFYENLQSISSFNSIFSADRIYRTGIDFFFIDPSHSVSTMEVIILHRMVVFSGYFDVNNVHRFSVL